MSEDYTVKLMKEAEKQYLGPHTSSAFELDPRHLAFTLSRYKFVAKMLEGKNSVLEVGCGDGFGSTIVAQAVKNLVGIDCEPYVIANAVENKWIKERGKLIVHDILESPYPEKFEAVFSLDVIEHIHLEDEDQFLKNIVRSSFDSSVLIIGTPNKTSESYASRGSRITHINLKTHASLKQTLSEYYQNVFMFGMNDEVLHTGFGSMCHYLLALATEPITSIL